MVPVVDVRVSQNAPESVQLRARDWAQFLSVPLNQTEQNSEAFVLEFSEDGLKLRDPQGRTLAIDFIKDHMNYRRKGLRGKNELLARALGGAKESPKVLDLSAGLGIDALFMTQLGFTVTAVERSRILYVLLQEALTKASESQPEDLFRVHAGLQSKVSFVCADAKEYLIQSANDFKFDAIYFDPMYPHKKKTALPKQEMVVFRELVGQDDDAAEVLETAVKTNAKRVVVKRPVGAPNLLPGVRHVYEGKVVRYDVYMR